MFDCLVRFENTNKKIHRESVHHFTLQLVLSSQYDNLAFEKKSIKKTLLKPTEKTSFKKEFFKKMNIYLIIKCSLVVSGFLYEHKY